MPLRRHAPARGRRGLPALLLPLVGLGVLAGCSTPPPKPPTQATAPARAPKSMPVRPAPPEASARSKAAATPATPGPAAAATPAPTAVAAAAPSAAPAPAAAPEPALPPAQPAPSVAEIEQLPQPEPQIEPIPQGGPNKPYRVAGETVVPMVRDEPFRDSGRASWYGRPFHGRRTANGEIFNMYGLSAAHRSMPLPSYARVRNRANGKEVIVRVNDRGPFIRGRMLDLSYAAAVKLGFVGAGVGQVEIERITAEDIRTGAWRRPSGASGEALATANPAPVVPEAPAISSAGGANEALKPMTALPGESDSTPIAATETATAPSPTVLPAPLPAPSGAAPGRHWLQLGAFRDLKGASAFQEKLQASAEWLAPLLTLVPDRGMTRLQAGPFPSREEAARASERVRAELNLVPMIVNRR